MVFINFKIAIIFVSFLLNKSEKCKNHGTRPSWVWEISRIEGRGNQGVEKERSWTGFIFCLGGWMQVGWQRNAI